MRLKIINFHTDKKKDSQVTEKHIEVFVAVSWADTIPTGPWYLLRDQKEKAGPLRRFGSASGEPAHRSSGLSGQQQRNMGSVVVTASSGMVDAVDKSVGTVVEALYEARMLDNTIILFLTDNGGQPWGPHASRGFNWPLRGTMLTVWEGR
ncbi:hypothetical protein HPB48_015126 [Haemaphysalis longicornis]|uniref:Arylsulfatase B n=1 Tax=Haemaphysalis longicornis TaxID=44386 RepID=A0A9J6G5A1_HAELO|nr:hypothetical protein HPB48_015126 [Haemaphysalis longicornis]